VQVLSGNNRSDRNLHKVACTFPCLYRRPLCSWLSILLHFPHTTIGTSSFFTRGAECFNPPAARTVVPYTYFRTKLVLAGKSKAEIKESIKTAMEKKELPALEAGAMCYMMSKDAYLNDGGGHNMAHLMFYTPLMDGAVWGANPIDDSNHVSFKFPNSPIFLTPQFLGDPEPMDNFVVPTGVWSAGTPDRR
jgi:hypothetical protein